MGEVMKRPDRIAKAYVFDMDGTIYLGNHLLPGARRLIDELRRREIPVRFLSNNPTKNPQQYVEKLNGLGLPTSVEDISNTVVTTTRWLVKNHPGATVFAIAEDPLKESLKRAGFSLSEDPAKIDIVIASYDRSFDYRKLQIAFDAIWFHRRAFLVQTNPDRFCPFPGGRGEPDCAAITAAIEACTGESCRVNLGKPSPLMVEEALSGLDVRPEEVVMVGDRLQTDIRMAVEAGMQSACVLTGEATAEDIRALGDDERPTWVVDRIDQLMPLDVWEELCWSDGNE